MRPLAVAEVRPPAAYEAVRVEALRHMLDQRLSRSIAVGDLLTLLFENRVTVAGAVEEQLRAAQIEEPERIAEEVALFNALIPGEREVAGTLFVETEDATVTRFSKRRVSRSPTAMLRESRWSSMWRSASTRTAS
jgi:hypothetical protein